MLQSYSFEPYNILLRNLGFRVVVKNIRIAANNAGSIKSSKLPKEALEVKHIPTL